MTLNALRREFWHNYLKNNIEDILRYDMNTQALKTLRTGSLITPFGGIKPVCHDLHKTVPEFIVILCDQMWMPIIKVRFLM